jgi:hypothetical protein
MPVTTGWRMRAQRSRPSQQRSGAARSRRRAGAAASRDIFGLTAGPVSVSRVLARLVLARSHTWEV